MHALQNEALLRNRYRLALLLACHQPFLRVPALLLTNLSVQHVKEGTLKKSFGRV